MIKLQDGDIIHKSGCLDLIIILNHQLTTAPRYERPKIEAEMAQIKGWIKAMGNNDTMIYKEAKNGDK